MSNKAGRIGLYRQARATQHINMHGTSLTVQRQLAGACNTPTTQTLTCIPMTDDKAQEALAAEGGCQQCKRVADGIHFFGDSGRAGECGSRDLPRLVLQTHVRVSDGRTKWLRAVVDGASDPGWAGDGVMSYDPTLPGLGEATRIWLVSTIQSSLTSLNTALQRDGLLPVNITSSMVMRGDPRILPDVSVAPLIICVSGGGNYGADMEIGQIYVPLEYRHQIYSAISVYLHPQALPTPAGNDLESGREILLDRVSDWLRGGVFNTLANVSPTLASQEYTTGTYDRLAQSHISDIEQGETQKGFAGSQLVHFARLRHSAWIA